MLEGILSTGLPGYTVLRLPPVFELTDDNQDDVLSTLQQSDYIFSQRVAPDYQLKWVRPAWLKEAFPGKVAIWPNLYFDGYFPDVQYVYLQPYGKLQGPLDDYHLRRVLDAHKAGRSLASAIEEIVEVVPAPDPFSTSIGQLTSREMDVDVRISDFLVNEVTRRRAFYTPNHPYNFVLIEMARRLASRAGLPLDQEAAERFDYRLDKIYIPVQPAIARSEGVTFVEEGTFRGRVVEAVTPSSIQLGLTKDYQTAEIVEEFYNLYDVVFGRPQQRDIARPIVPPPEHQSLPRKLRIGLVGYYGYGNYGDELFKDVLYLNLPDMKTEVLDVPRLSNDPDYLARFSKEVDAVILGGGDLIIPTGWAPWYYSEHLLTKPLFIFGVGVPTWVGVDQKTVAKLRDFFQHPNVRFIGVRDVESRLWVEQHLKPAVTVNQFPDMVCALPLPDVLKPQGKKIFTLVTRHQRPGEINWTNVQALCRRATDYGYHVRNLVLGTGSTAADDLKTLENEDPGIEWELVQRDNNLALTIALGESTVVASMKFHGCVAATMFGIPSIGLSTTDKFTNLFRIIERLDLQSHHTHGDLADRLPRFIVPVPGAVTARLRSGAERGMQCLRNSIRQEVE